MSTDIAPTIEQGAKTVRKSKGKGKIQKTVTRSALTSPYALEWPPLPSGVTPDILSEIQRTFQPLQCVLGKRRCKNRKQTERRKVEMESNPESMEEERRKSALRSQLALGINEVTRSLEKGHLQLLMVCRSAKPDLMTSHLPTLSATRGCPALAVFHLSNTLSPLLNMKTVLAIGFKKPQDGNNLQDFAGLVSYVSGKCPTIKVPWLDLKHLPPEELAAALSRDVFNSRRNSGNNAVVMDTQQGKMDEPTTAVTVPETSQTDAFTEETVLKGIESEVEEPEQEKTKAMGGSRSCRDDGSVSDGKAGRTTEEVGRTENREDFLGNSREDEGVCPDEAFDTENADRQSQGTKKRKLSEISASPGKDDAESKRKKTAKMPFQSTNVMHVKIITKASKGKKGKSERGKKK